MKKGEIVPNKRNKMHNNPELVKIINTLKNSSYSLKNKVLLLIVKEHAGG